MNSTSRGGKIFLAIVEKCHTQQATDHLLVKAILGYRFNNKKD
jgi:hypothetical protein